MAGSAPGRARPKELRPGAPGPLEAWLRQRGDPARCGAGRAPRPRHGVYRPPGAGLPPPPARGRALDAAAQRLPAPILAWHGVHRTDLPFRRIIQRRMAGPGANGTAKTQDAEADVIRTADEPDKRRWPGFVGCIWRFRPILLIARHRRAGIPWLQIISPAAGSSSENWRLSAFIPFSRFLSCFASVTRPAVQSLHPPPDQSRPISAPRQGSGESDKSAPSLYLCRNRPAHP